MNVRTVHHADTSEDHPPKFAFEDFADITFEPDDEFLIQGLWPRTGHATVWGESGCGKTFLMISVALHVAMGWTWAGRQVEPGLVVYVAAEGSQGIKKRIEGIRKRYGLEDQPVPFVLVRACPDFGTGRGDALILARDIRRVEARYGRPVRLVILDTLARMMCGADEDRAADMGVYLGNAELVASELGCLVVSVHHSGKDESRGMRGSYSLKAGIDAEWHVQADEGGGTVTVKKNKDEGSGQTWRFVLARIELGLNKHDRPISTCTAEVIEPIVEVNTESRGPPLGTQARVALEALDEAIAQHGEELPAHAGPSSIKGVRIKDWKAQCRAKGIVLAPAGEDGAKSETVRKAINRALGDLRRRHLIVTQGDWVWRIKPGSHG